MLKIIWKTVTLITLKYQQKLKMMLPQNAYNSRVLSKSNINIIKFIINLKIYNN